MNWFKKISSFNLRFTDEIEQDIKEVAKTVLNYYLSKNQEPLAAGVFKFTDPYQNIQRQINIVVLPSSQTSDQIAHYDSKEKTISIFPYNLQAEITNENMLLNAFEDAIKHEAAHVIDPKFRLKPKKKTNIYEYYSPIEFDGYSKQITEQIKREIKNNSNIKPTVEEWLRTDTLQQGNPILNYIEVLTAWDQSDQENNTDYIRRLKLRIYNEALQED